MKKHKLTGQGGKGSARRTANEQAYADGWEAIFGKNKKEDKNESDTQIQKDSKDK